MERNLDFLKKEVDSLKNENNLPKIEEKSLIMFENKGKIKPKKDDGSEDKKKKKREINQIRLNIPKKFIDYLKLNKDDFKATAYLHKDTQKIVIEVVKNESIN